MKILDKIFNRKTFNVKRRFPNYFSGFEETEHVIKNRKELEEIDWVANFVNGENHHTLAIEKAVYDYEGNRHTLMDLSYYDEKYGGCKMWWVIGFIEGDDIDKLGLPEWNSLTGDHLDGCPQKAWQHDECTCGFR